MKWAKSLIIANNESIENRLGFIFRAIINELGNIKCMISFIDATGQLGNEFTKRNNNGETIQTDIKEIISLTQEDGQIIELDLLLISEGDFRVLVTDGQHIDVLGKEYDISRFIGEHTDMDPQLFNE